MPVISKMVTSQAGFPYNVRFHFLSTIIPKAQYYITKLKTGSDKFPGVKDMDQAA